ncbi:MAG: hypothetical protein OSA40_01450 [Phycisphaerales bacterium]|nr:hypothetical protein [Alphaproteobacteria bacterium]MDE0888102.1 hypothetical protein [Phycisphaerales bacterium]
MSIRNPSILFFKEITMIHAAIATAALFCSPTTLQSAIDPTPEESIAIYFEGGSVADYVFEVAEAFAEFDPRSNIVLLPGTEKIELPSISLKVAHPRDALAAIADHFYKVKDGTQVYLDFEQVGLEEDILRVSGKNPSPSNVRGRTPSPRVVVDRGVAILRVDRSALETAITLSSKVLDLAGLLDTSTLFAVPNHDLLLVSSTDTGQDLVEQIVLELNASNAKQLQNTEPTHPIDARRGALKKELVELAKIRLDKDVGAEVRMQASKRFARALQQLRRAQDP